MSPSAGIRSGRWLLHRRLWRRDPSASASARCGPDGKFDLAATELRADHGVTTRRRCTWGWRARLVAVARLGRPQRSRSWMSWWKGSKRSAPWRAAPSRRRLARVAPVLHCRLWRTAAPDCRSGLPLRLTAGPEEKLAAAACRHRRWLVVRECGVSFSGWLWRPCRATTRRKDVVLSSDRRQPQIGKPAVGSLSRASCTGDMMARPRRVNRPT